MTGTRRWLVALTGCMASVLGWHGDVLGDSRTSPLPSAGCGLAKIETGERLERTIEVDGVTRSYLLDVPATAKPGRPVPLMFDFHGLGHSAAGVWKVSRFRELATRDPSIAVYPDGLPVRFERPGRKLEGAGWEVSVSDGNRDLQFVTRMLEHLENAYCIDRARIYSTGFSNGAYLSHLIACRMAGRFAAIAPVSGGRVPAECSPSRGIPVLIQHGRQDELIEVEQARSARDTWIRLNGCREHVSNGCEWHRECRDGAVVEYCEEDFAHRWPVQATERVWNFFRKHSMPSSPASGTGAAPTK
jgi:polyhydroxybutyrate depolymerase